MAFQYWNKKSFVLVTGASRGLGRTIAIEFSKKVAPGSVFLLVARTADALEETKAAVLAESPSVEVITKPLDLGKPNKETYLELVTSAVTANGRSARDFEHAILVHNAGSLGNLALKVSQFEDIDEIESYYSFNVFSMIVLNTQFLRVFSDESQQRSVLQITSLGAVQPFKTWGYYCSGKAARDMLMRSLALEDPSINVLNYAPGPFESAIYEEATKNTGDEETRKLFNATRDEGKILTPEQTTRKLVKILGEKKYAGDHIDFYDVPDE
jgi:sepiapterin reductase